MPENNAFDPKHTQLNHIAGKKVQHSTQYACHIWTKDAQLVVATEQGELLLCKYTGEMTQKIDHSPGKRIICMTVFNRGIIVGGEDGRIWVYETVNSEHMSPLRLLHENHGIKFSSEPDPSIADNMQEKNAKITSMTLNKQEDRLYIMTDTR